MKIIDLHSHTTESDGSLSPRELVRLAKSQGISSLAITDHDTVSGIEEATSEAQTIGDIEIIPGVELSANFRGEVHILGYFLNIHDPSFISDLKELQTIREIRNNAMIDKFRKHGIDITLQDVESEAKGEAVGRPHFAAAIIKKGVVDTYQDAFRKYLGDSGRCFVPKKQYHPEKAISIIRDNGGVAVLAHPVHVRKAETRTKMKSILTDLKSFGLSGIEAMHPDHSKEKTAQYLELAETLDLCVTGGSDYHGAMKPDIQPGVGRGSLCIPYSYLEMLKLRQTELNGVVTG